MSSVVPEGWSEDYISEYFDFSIGGTPSRNNELYWDANQTTSNIWVSIRDLKDKFISNSAERISDLGVSKSNVKLLPKNTVLMSFKLSIGRLAISMTPLYTNEAIVGFIEKRPNTVDRDYLYYGLQSWNLLGEVDQAVKGATLNKDKMSRILGVFPPLPEQKKIASILTSVDEVIENTQKQIDKLQDLKKATMNELLTKGIGHTEFKDSELGRIPKSWEVRAISEVVSIPNGQVDPKLEPYASMPHIGSGNIISWIGQIKGVQTAFEAGQISGKYLFSKNHILYSKVRPNLAKVCMPQFDGICSADVYPLIPKQKVSGKFVFQYLLTEKFTQIATEVSERTGMPKINRQDLNVLKLPMPPFEEQSEIARKIEAIDKATSLKSIKLAQTKSLKKSLMQDLLTGKVRVAVN